jgi:TRAP-type C4-dicarboxylate transport system permease small subunit
MKDMWNQSLGAIYTKPMGGYVIFSWMAMILTIVVALFSYTQIKCEGSDTDKKLTTTKAALLIACAVAVIHMLVAFWMQRQIVKEMCKKMDEEYEEKQTPPEERTYEIIDNEAGRKRSAICEILKYDFVFCLYFFFAPAAFGFAVWAMSNFPKCSETAAWAAWWTFGILIGYGSFTGLYFFFTLCGICCGSGKDKVKKTVKNAKKRKEGP